MNSSPLAKFLVILAALFFAACGRPATEAECKEILHRTAALEMKGRLGNKDLIEQEITVIAESMREQMMKKCVGKRITDDALKCVRSAKTAEELAEECFR
jgi:hypothetical protein